jgi:putative PEP-CTERM system TPR-repeat lipoprotein
LLATTPEDSEALLLKAELQLAQRDVDAARITLEKAIAADPASVQPRVRLASLLIDRADLPGAEVQQEALARLAPGAPITLYLKALIDFRKGRLPAARDGVQAVLKEAPDFVAALALGASVALAENALEQAETMARQLAERAPQSPQGARLTAAVAMRRGDFDRALRIARSAIERAPEDAALLGLAGEASLRLGNVGAATSYFEQATRLAPGDPTKRTGLGLARLSAGFSEAGFAELEAATEIDAASTQADLTLIAARMRARQYDRALASIGRLEAKQPGAALPHNLRGTVLLAKGDVPGARASFERALQIDPSLAAAAANLAELDMRDGEPAKARARLGPLVQRNPLDVGAAMALARVLERTGASRDETEETLRKAQRANPTAIEPVLALGRSYLQSDKLRDAVSIVQQALNHHPDDRRLLDLLGTALLLGDQKQQAIEVYERLVRLDPKNPSVHLRMGEVKATAGDPSGALASFRQAAELDTRSPAPQLAIAVLHAKEGRKAEAARIATSLQKQFPASPAGASLEGDLHAADGRWVEAATAYRKAGAMQLSAALAVKLHRTLMRAGRTTEADSSLADAIRAAPADVALRMYAGESAITMKRWRIAADHYEAALAASPHNVVAMNNLAWALNELKDPRAKRMAEDAHARAPQSAPVADTLGVVRTATGDARGGVEALRKAVSIAPSVPQYRLHLAQALAAAGDAPAARAEIDRLLAQTPAGPVADEARALAAAF